MDMEISNNDRLDEFRDSGGFTTKKNLSFALQRVLARSTLSSRPIKIFLNEIQFVGEDFEKLRYAEEIDKYGYSSERVESMGTIPKEIFEFNNLVVLDVSRNSLTSLDYKIGKLMTLKELILSKNVIRDLPSELFELRSLETLDLSENSISELPGDIEKLTGLRKLNLKSNQLSKIPYQITRLKSLEMLDLTDNPLPIPPEIIARTDQPQIILTYIQEIYFFKMAKREHDRYYLT